jgi:hypothetical protein
MKPKHFQLNHRGTEDTEKKDRNGFLCVFCASVVQLDAGQRSRKLGMAAFLACTVFAGCGKAVPPDPLGGQANITVDESVLRALDAYNPVYQVDRQGHIVRLKLDGARITDVVLDEVGKLSELINLSLYGATIDNNSLAKLENLKKLEALGIAGTQVDADGFSHLQKLPNLRWIWLPKEHVTEEQKDKLVTKCSRLEQAYLQ